MSLIFFDKNSISISWILQVDDSCIHYDILLPYIYFIVILVTVLIRYVKSLISSNAFGNTFLIMLDAPFHEYTKCMNGNVCMKIDKFSYILFTSALINIPFFDTKSPLCFLFPENL